MAHPRIFASMIIEGGRKNARFGDENSRWPEACLLEDERDLERVYVDGEYYFIPFDHGTIGFFHPPSRTFFTINAEGRELIERLKGSSFVKLDRHSLAFINNLALHGVIRTYDGTKCPDSESARMARQRAFVEGPYLPTTITISPTTDCNLRCIYCYVSGGSRKKYMSLPLGKRAVDFAIRNAIETETKDVVLILHGSGEPMLAFDFVKDIVGYARDESSKHGLRLNLNLGTNLFFDKERLGYLIENFDWVTVSIDGPKDVQDAQRVTDGGTGSFDMVFENLKELDRSGNRYGLRSTVTKLNVDRMGDMVEFFAKNFPNAHSTYHFEPVVMVSRAVEWGAGEVDHHDFMLKLEDARKIAGRYGKNVETCTSSIMDMGGEFCGSPHNPFWLTPDGIITASADVVDRDDPLADYFVIGEFDEGRGDFSVDLDRVRRLRTRFVNNMPGCRTCFAKYHCRGYSPTQGMRILGEFLDMSKLPFCDDIREAIRLRMMESLSREECSLEEDDYLVLGDPSRFDEIDITSENFRPR